MKVSLPGAAWAFAAPLKAWRQAVRMTVAALLAYAGTRAFHLHQGQWAVITCLVVVQGSFANTLDASLARAYGTLAGAFAGGLGALVLARTGLPEGVVLTLALAPTAALSAGNVRFRLAPVTAAIVVLAVSSGSAAVDVAADRVGEILFGGVIGVACTLFILPERAEDALIRHAADALALLGTLAEAHLLGGAVDSLLVRMEAAFARAQAATAEVGREQRVHLGRGPPPRPFMRALRRLRTDVALIERIVLIEEDASGRERVAAAVAAWFAAASAALRAGAPLPESLPLAHDEAAAEGSGFGAFAFAIEALRRDQDDLRIHAAERFRKADPEP